MADDEVEVNTRRHTYIDFVGDISSGPSFELNGTLRMDTFGPRQSSFENVSVQLYRNDGSLITSDCLGTLSKSHSLNVSLAADEHPEYVIFASHDFWTEETVDDFQVQYYVRDEGEYRSLNLASPSSLQVDIRGTEPCDGTDGGG